MIRVYLVALEILKKKFNITLYINSEMMMQSHIESENIYEVKIINFSNFF